MYIYIYIQIYIYIYIYEGGWFFLVCVSAYVVMCEVCSKSISRKTAFT